MTDKIWLQQEALRALPPDLRMEAEIIDETPFPIDRPMPFWDTPPIPDFDPLDYVGKSKKDVLSSEEDIDADEEIDETSINEK